ncbi:cytochrome c nitrite reductase pentaheme subunit [Enterovibrio nigricans]|uniref:Respiratory nitrite reductase specific menaquinol--cytochrome-c reductase complex subunit NrfB n=1 Tax=Enterovibrio nigricans DSM 22720 TaxID=1121868 RepID=A0A1T4VZ68_9GAMM|nr:cytochrome c nitrite reductase pentaheme subunit [Enterovibrio nigricans]PKF49037.1 cytochrome c nitrite reductase pentaheme subunit [Enterovibrio nigricans]SKA70310.1 respiratory nitrite reductase specific menaquinol--cytochrome-c reductase complex subunit NrfB precursor [Enterovibrio nigricans DSM 22720]
MSNIKVNLSWLATLFTVLCLWGISLHVASESKDSTVDSVSTPALQHEVTFQRNPDYACVQCHKDEENKLAGAHNDVINPNNNRSVTCVDCHTSITPSHRDGATDVVKFDHSQSVSGTTLAASSVEWITKQNEACETCHEPTQLQEANWTHDVHARDLTCSSCHTVHPATDPMKGLTSKAAIETCVDCHTDQRLAQEEKQ